MLTAFGSMARIAKTAIDQVREEGMKVGLIRPITLYPFPAASFKNLPESVSRILTCEMNTGQMVEDVRLSLDKRILVDFYGRPGGSVPTPEEIFERLQQAYAEVEQ